jgi:hypothetical protein
MAFSHNFARVKIMHVIEELCYRGISLEIGGAGVKSEAYLYTRTKASISLFSLEMEIAPPTFDILTNSIFSPFPAQILSLSIAKLAGFEVADT